MLEPVVGALVGWAWLSEGLGSVQLAGAVVVLARSASRRPPADALLALDERAQLGQLLASQVVALAALDPLEQVAHERSELDAG